MDIDVMSQRVAEHHRFLDRFKDLLPRLEKHWPMLESLMEHIEENDPEVAKTLRERADKKSVEKETDPNASHSTTGTAAEGEFGGHPSEAQVQLDRSGAQPGDFAGGHSLEEIPEEHRPKQDQERLAVKQMQPDDQGQREASDSDIGTIRGANQMEVSQEAIAAKDAQAVRDLRAEAANAPYSQPRASTEEIAGGRKSELPDQPRPSSDFVVAETAWGQARQGETAAISSQADADKANADAEAEKQAVEADPAAKRDARRSNK